MIQEILNPITEISGVRILEDTSDSSWIEKPEIDLFVPTQVFSDVKKLLKRSGWILSLDGPYGVRAHKTLDGRIRTLDLVVDLQYLAQLFPRVRLTEKCLREVLDDKHFFAYVQAILLLRKSPKHLKRIEDGSDTYLQRLADPAYIHPPLIRANVTSDRLVALVQRRWGALFRVCGIRNTVSRYVARLRRSRTKGRVVAIVGVDGAGKSTITAIAQTFPRTRLLYMGDGQFFFMALYKRLYKVGTIGKMISYGVQYVEVWCRLAKAWLVRRKGFRVVTDRYPNFNRHMVLHKKWYQLSRILFSLIPPADVYVFLCADPEVIHARKQELTISEIETYQASIEAALQTYPATYTAYNKTVDEAVDVVIKAMVTPV